jgi:site-specific DNA-methyltransferase (adenine-specific)
MSGRRGLDLVSRRSFSKGGGMDNQIIFAENLPVLRTMPSASANMIYIDPPFNTGKIQARTQISTVASENGDRIGFQGHRYQTTNIGSKAFFDAFDDYLGFLRPRLVEAHRILARNGTLYVHLDYREVHYVKVLLDSIFGRDCFLNEIIWAYDYGGRAKNKWPPKHDTILVFVKNPGDYVFNYDDIDRIPYMAPGLVGPEKAARGKMPTDTWWHTIVPTNGKEKTGYPTQKPVGILKRMILASSNPGDLVLDFFAGSGTTGEACQQTGRRFVLIDENPEALQVMARRFDRSGEIEWVGFDPKPYQAAEFGTE